MRGSVITILALSGLLLSACGANNAQTSVVSTSTEKIATPLEIVASTWPQIIDGDELPLVDVDLPRFDGGERVLALAVGSGEVVDLLGAGSQLVGKDETSITTVDVPTVTQGHQIDVERALTLEPSVVLVDELTGPPEAIDSLAEAGARIVNVPAVWTLDDVEDRVTVIAGAVGAMPQSAALLSSALVATTPVTAARKPRVAFLYLRGPSAVYLLGGRNTGADTLIDAAGGVDVGSDLGYEGFVPLTSEAIVQADPDVLLVMSDGLASVGGIEGLLALPGVAQTRAGDGERVVAVDDRVLLSFGARTPALMNRLAQVFAEGTT